MFLQIRSDFPIFPSEIEVFGAFLKRGPFLFFLRWVKRKTKNCKLQVLWPDYWYFLPHPDDLPTAREPQGISRTCAGKWKDLQEAPQPKKKSNRMARVYPWKSETFRSLDDSFWFFSWNLGKDYNWVRRSVNQSINQSINQSTYLSQIYSCVIFVFLCLF